MTNPRFGVRITLPANLRGVYGAYGGDTCSVHLVGDMAYVAALFAGFALLENAVISIRENEQIATA